MDVGATRATMRPACEASDADKACRECRWVSVSVFAKSVPLKFKRKCSMPRVTDSADPRAESGALQRRTSQSQQLLATSALELLAAT